MNNDSIRRVKDKAQEIIHLGVGMQANEYMGALALASGQALRHLCTNTLDESLDWFMRSVHVIASTTPEDEKYKQ